MGAVSDQAWLGVAVVVYMPLAVGSSFWMVWNDLPLSSERSGAAAAVGLGVGLCMVGASRLAAKNKTYKAFESSLAGTLGELSLPAAALLAGLSSMGEELFFRGVIQGTWGIALATLAFGLAHIPFERGLMLWPLLAAGAGLIFGAITVWEGGVIGAAVAHATVNFLNLRHIAEVAAASRPPPLR
jgi:uncharacterized protein